MLRAVPAACFVCLILVTHAAAMFMMPTDVPVDRVLKNAEAYVKEHPDDAHGHYVLGRIHYLAWTSKAGLVPVYPHDLPEAGAAKKPELPGIAFTSPGGNLMRARAGEAQRRAMEAVGITSLDELDDAARERYWAVYRDMVKKLTEEEWKPPALAVEKLDAHARAAIASFKKALEMDARNGLYHLGLASLYEELAPRAGEARLDLHASPVEKDQAKEAAFYTTQMQKAALDGYADAYRATIAADRKLKHRPLEGLEGLVSYNAINGYLRLHEATGGKLSDDKLVKAMQADKTAIEDIPFGAITPIVFTLSDAAELSQLLDTDTTVAFDLDGTGRAQRYTWVKPTTALLCWDPRETGRITSGRQLFGSVSWWLLPRDGYHAMDLLDDNRDGELTGDELAGLSAWFDRNSNGISDDGEVLPLRDLGIVGLRTRAESFDGSSPTHPRGLRTADGRVLPTWDWVTTPVMQQD